MQRFAETIEMKINWLKTMSLAFFIVNSQDDINGENTFSSNNIEILFIYDKIRKSNVTRHKDYP